MSALKQRAVGRESQTREGAVRRYNQTEGKAGTTWRSKTTSRHTEPANEQEEIDKQVILSVLGTRENAFSREALTHMACSIWVVSPDCAQTLLVFHNIYGSWSWIGGHADGDRDLAAVALRELQEETGVSHARMVTLPAGNIYSLEVLTVDGHEKRGKYVGSHLHLNVTYLAVASPTSPSA